MKILNCLFYEIRRLIGGPRLLEDSFLSQSDPRLMLSDQQGWKMQIDLNVGSLPGYPFKFFVYFHERLLQMRANGSDPGIRLNGL